MSTEVINSYLSNIEEFVFDEKKIVTYSWLATTLGIHSNLSKQLLHTFFEQSQKKEELSVTYLLIGSLDGGNSQVSIVKDKDLGKYESSLESVTSKHIYSLQKCVDLSNINVLYTAQKGETVDTISKGISAIDFNCNERDGALLAKLKSDALPVPSKQPVGGKKAVPPPSNKPKSPFKNKSAGQNKEVNGSADDKAGTAKEKTVIPSMFKSSKPAENKPGLKNKPAQKAAVNNKKPQGIGAFFSKSTNKESIQTKKIVENEKAKDEKESPISERLSPLKENKATLNIVKENNSKTNESPQEISPKSKKSQSKPKTTTKKGKGTKKGTVKKVEKKEKKRKRLVVISDSESENSNEEEEEEVVREPTPEPQPSVIPDDDDEDFISATPEPASRKRKKKLINKTFTTPDGYMVTEKQYVDESCSEDEDAAPEKKFKETKPEDDNGVKESEINSGSTTVKASSVKTDNAAPKNKKSSPKNKKASSPQKTKQASLTSFFKKK